MKFDRINYEKMKINDNTPVPEGYMTTIQNNEYHDVVITTKQCRNSIRVFSQMKKIRNSKNVR